MAQKVTCPVCKSKLQEMTKGHISTKKHAKALKNAGVDSSADPALDLIPKPQKEINDDNIVNRMEDRISNLEDIVYQLLEQQERILSYYDLDINNLKNNGKQEIKTAEILRAINQLAQNNKRKNPWVKIDAVVNLLNIDSEVDIINLNKLLTDMFNKKLIDLAETGNPKHPILFQNRTYGKVAIQK
ncbi:MAG: hypothetical protein ACFE9R_19775 [Candidatus Hermodarchaeota archaeon]